MAQIGELFFTLGVQGGDKTLQTLAGMQKGISNVASTSLAAKAAIVGVIYAFGSLLGASGQFGQNVSTMSSVLGISTKQLQQFEQAGIKAGVSIQDMDATINSSFSKMKSSSISGVLPDMWNFLNQTVGIDKERWLNPETHLQEIFGSLQRLSKRTDITPAIKQAVSENFGISNYSILQGIERGKFAPDVIARQPFKSEGAIEQLNQVAAKLKQVKNEITSTFDNWSSEHGVQILEDFHKIEIAFLGMVTQLDKLLTKFGAFEKLANFFLFIAEALHIATNALIRLQGGKPEDEGKTYLEKYADLKTQEALANAGANKAALDLFFAKGKWFLGDSAPVKSFFSKSWDWLTEKGISDEELRMRGLLKNVGENAFGYLDRFNVDKPSIMDFVTKSLSEPSNFVTPQSQSNNQQVTVNQDISFNHPGTDFQQTASSMRDATVQAAQAWKFNPAHLRLT